MFCQHLQHTITRRHGGGISSKFYFTAADEGISCKGMDVRGLFDFGQLFLQHGTLILVLVWALL